MGASPHNGVIRIRDRYVQVAFDLKLKEADESCLYADFEGPKVPKKINYAKEWEKISGKKPPKLIKNE